MECQICYYKYTSKLRRKFTCYECSNSVCTVCIFKHMVNNIDDMKCFFCETDINVVELRDYLSVTKYNQLANKEVDYCFKKEISLLDQTRRVLDEEQRLIEMEIVINWMRRDGLSDAVIQQTLNDMGYMENKNPRTKLHRIRSCPTCNDLLRETEEDYTCEKCKIHICGVCVTEKKTNHVCEEAVLDTLRHIQVNCIECPKCKILINKEEGGCDQMFCVECKTTFSWRTGRIVNKGEAHHNPHFYEWKRQQLPITERNQLDNPCEGYFLMKCEKLNDTAIIPETLATTTLRGSKGTLVIDKGVYLRFVQGMLMHSIETILNIRERDEYIRQQFRTRYLTKRISFSKWKRRFKQHINTLRRNSETKTLLLTCLDGLYHIVLSENANTCMVDNLFKFITTSLKDVQEKYGRTINYIISTDQVVLPYMRN